MLKCLLVSFVLSWAVTAQAQPPSDPSIEGLVWNRWTKDRFVVLSIDDSQGKFLAENIEPMKAWVLNRWGFSDIPLSAECKIVCVPNKTLLKKLFNLNDSRVEVRRNDRGKIESTVMWLSLDKPPRLSLAPYLTEVLFSEFEQKYNVQFGLWFKKGAGVLNTPVDNVRVTLKSLSHQYDSKSLFALNVNDWHELESEEQNSYIKEFAALCLLLRKEFGQSKLHEFLRHNPDQGIVQVYRFPTMTHFDASLGRFSQDVVREINNSKMPDFYLNITPSE